MGRAGWTRGPCACPRVSVIPLGFHDAPPDKDQGTSSKPRGNRSPMRTSTRPPHPPNPSHCHYWKGENACSNINSLEGNFFSSRADADTQQAYGPLAMAIVIVLL